MNKPTAEDKRHFGKVAELGCIVCRLFFNYHTPASVHHVRAGLGMGQRNHKKVIPLCPGHHQHGGVGIAFHASKYEFEKNFDTEENLLSEVKKLI